MDISFKVAIALSALIHSALFIPAYKTFTANTENQVPRTVVIDYVRTDEGLQTLQFLKSGGIKSAVSGLRSQGNVISAKREARKLMKEQASLRASPLYINYYQLIRETIRQRLKNHYKTINAKGDVALVFILTSSGALAAIDVNEAKSVQDAALIRIAMKSVKESSPFPPFPKELAVPKMSFDLTIAFKKD